jgi:aspartate aminotransferase
MKTLSSRTENMTPSLTVAIDTLAKKMKAEGKDIVSLGAGEPDLNTPTAICKAGIDAILAGKLRYTAPTGILEVREAVSHKLMRDNHLTYNADHIIMTSGAKHAVFNVLAALINPGDEIIIPSPYWVTYPELVKWLGGIPVFINASAENHFKITAQQLQEAVTPKTKAIIFNNPCNPTGAVYSFSELEKLSKVILEEDLYCISDEVYEYFIYKGSFVSMASLNGMYERTILINGVSKSHCMTGWRLGYNAAPLAIAKVISKIQSQAIHHPSNITQYAGLAALNMDLESVFSMRDEFLKRRDYMLSRFQEIKDLFIAPPDGAFYLFVSVKKIYGKKTPEGKIISNSSDLCHYLLESEGLAIVPGAAFGDDSCVRFSYAADLETLTKACDRFERGIKNLG